MSTLCKLLGYTRQAFYGYRQHHHQEAFETELIVQEVLKHRRLQPRLGTRKLLIIMQDFVSEHNISLGRDALFDLLREHHLLIRKRKSRKAQTTCSKHWYRKYANLIRGFEPLAPNLLWVSDITYITVTDTFAYLSLITDAYSRKVAGFYLSQTLQASGSIKALQMALNNAGEDTTNLIHHSDRGVQYCCSDYVQILDDKHIRISMTENGDPLENAIAERVKTNCCRANTVVFRKLKRVWLHPSVFTIPYVHTAVAVCLLHRWHTNKQAY